MNIKFTLAGFLILIGSIYLIVVRPFLFLISIIGIVVSLYLLFIGLRSPSEGQIARKANSVIFNEIMSKGTEKIKNGTMAVSQEQFESVMNKISWVFGSQSYMPQIGFNSLYLHFFKGSRCH